MIGTIATVASLLLNAYGQNQSANAAEEQQNLLNKRMGDLDSWYKGESSKDYTQTAEGQSTMRRLESQMKKALESENNSAVKTGATPESKVAMQGALTEKYGDAVSQLSGLTTQRKDNLRRDYTSSMNNLLNQQSNMYTQDQENWSNFASNIGSALSSVSEADAAGAFDDLFNTYKPSNEYVAGSGSGMYSSRGF